MWLRDLAWQSAGIADHISSNPYHSVYKIKIVFLLTHYIYLYQISHFAIVLAVVAALALSTSAEPSDADAEKCPFFCKQDTTCRGCKKPRQCWLLIAVQNYQPQLKSRRLQLVCDRMSSVEGFSTASHQLASAKRPCVAICWHCGHLMFKVTQNIIRLIKARLVSYRPSILFVSQIAPLHTMRLSFAMVLPVVAALASLTSASLADADAKPCPIFCRHTRQCSGCPAVDCFFFICH